MIHPRLTLNHAVAVLALLLGMSMYMLMVRFQIPERIAWGSAILSILVVSILWTSINLADEDEDD